MQVKNYVSKFTQEELSLLLVKRGKILFKSKKSGLKPLIAAIDTKGRASLTRVNVFDKAVGKAVALIISYLQGEWVYTPLLSQSGKETLERFEIPYKAGQIVERLSEVGSDAQCPFEKAVKDIKDPATGYQAIREIVKA